MPPEGEASGSERRLARERRARREAESIAENAIRQQYEAVQELQRSKAVLDETTDFVIIADIDGRVRYMNRALLEVLDVQAEAVGNHVVADLLTSESRSRFESEAMVALADKGVWRGELAMVLPSSGQEIPVSQVLIGHRDIDGDLDSMSSISRDISDQHEMEAQLTRLALHDPLTGLPNRRLFFDRFDIAIARAARTLVPVGLFYMDLDGFKTINDSYGHEAGDELLIAVADRLVSGLRSSDTVCRVGGDEFCALCEHVGDGSGALEVAERLMEKVAKPITLGDNEVHVTLSVGIVVASGAPDGKEALLRQADLAMYQAKRAGKARAVVGAVPSQ